MSHRERSPFRRAAAMLVALALGTAATAGGQQGNVATTVHNLSVSGPGALKSGVETEICKFCHIPHSAVVREPLWGHALSRVEPYSVPQNPRTGWTPPQPDGSSRLCLSCHDGTVAVGDLGGRGAGRADGLGRLQGRQSSLGVDLSGSHPVSFVVPDGDSASPGEGADIGLRPLSLIRADRQVHLDAQGKMQCTTCHDPHSDVFYRPGTVPRFLTKPSVSEVCVTCHELR